MAAPADTGIASLTPLGRQIMKTIVSRKVRMTIDVLASAMLMRLASELSIVSKDF